MPWCPQCGVEYRDGFSACSECRVSLVAELPRETAAPEATGSTQEWVVVAVYSAAEDADLALGFLRSEGIDAELVGSQVQPLPVEEHTAGEHLVQVPWTELERAAALLADADQGRLTIGEQDAPATADGGEESTS
jgi:hypothetical protein